MKKNKQIFLVICSTILCTAIVAINPNDIGVSNYNSESIKNNLSTILYSDSANGYGCYYKITQTQSDSSSNSTNDSIVGKMFKSNYLIYDSNANSILVNTNDKFINIIKSAKEIYWGDVAKIREKLLSANDTVVGSQRPTFNPNLSLNLNGMMYLSDSLINNYGTITENTTDSNFITLTIDFNDEVLIHQYHLVYNIREKRPEYFKMIYYAENTINVLDSEDDVVDLDSEVLADVTYSTYTLESYNFTKEISIDEDYINKVINQKGKGKNSYAGFKYIQIKM